MGLSVIDDVRLVPVVELEPHHFASKERPAPVSSAPEAWGDYWRESLADAGITGVPPLRPGSWHVPVTHLRDTRTLGLILAATLEQWGGVEALTGPDAVPVFGGGLALCAGDEVLAEPACCVDLRNLSDWLGASAYRGAGWQILWIGHPWLSVRFGGGSLTLSERHEGAEPEGRWAVTPEALDAAVRAAASEMEAFAARLLPAVSAHVGGEEARLVARSLAGLGG